jgi:N-carbamoyl-L-amino-acid hydrolase
MRWYEVTVYGEDAHTGATPMHLRKNALLGAARVIDAVDAIGHGFAPDAVATVGLIENKPNSRNVVPGEVFFTIDLRHPDENVLDQMESRMKTALAAILDPLQLTYQEKKIWTSPAIRFAPELIHCVRRAAKEAGLPTCDIVSGAGHDAVYVARVAPTTMIFVPCLKGISHNEAESTSFGECAAGAQVLLNALLEYDRTLA